MGTAHVRDGSLAYGGAANVAPAPAAASRVGRLSAPCGRMATRLDKPIRRELDLDGKLYTVTISPDGVKVVEKGRRKGQELSWHSIVSGDARLAEDLSISLDATME